MSTLTRELTQRERELGAIISAYNEVTEQLKFSHERLSMEVVRLREELADKNRQLRRRERLAALGEMAAGVAHEIRNPLGAVRVFASLLQRDLTDRPDALDIVEKISRCVGRLEAIVNEILVFGRPSALNPVPVHLGRLVAETVELAAARAEGASLTIEIGEGLDEAELVTDAGLLQRALLNLLVNAIEATAGRGHGGHDAGGCGRVVIELGRITDDRVTLVVRDQGPGIPPDLLDRVFNPFFTTKDDGTGLGLAIVHQIAEILGGSVQAANQNEGGAAFSLCIPKVTNEET